MKRILQIAVILVCLMLSMPKTSTAEDMMRLPEDPKGLVGKTMSFTDDDKRTTSTWYVRITGVSKHFQGEGKSTVFYFNGINYSGYPVKQLSCHSNFASDWCQLEYYIPTKQGDVVEKNKPVHIISLD